MLKSYFSKFIDPMGIDDTSQPPTTVYRFFRYYLDPIRGLLLATLALSGIATVSELLLYVYLGDIVDWMGDGNREGFFQEHQTALIMMFVVAVIIRPLSLLASRGLISFSLVVGLGNRIRWHNHRYVLRQSLSYFQNDFAGRVAQKVMQTGNSAREAVINVIDGLWLLVVYLVGIVWLFVDMDWRLLAPVVLWLCGYALVIIFMVPSVRGRSSKLSEANSQLLGQIVDGYTNIQSVKLFATNDQEDAYAGKFMRRHTEAFRNLMESIFNMTVALTMLNTALVVGTAIISIILWQQDEVSVGTIAIANALIMRVNQMSGWILRSITSLFEQFGTVQNGISTISKPNEILDAKAAKTLQLSQGVIEFENMSFRYSDDNQVIEQVQLKIKPGEKVGLVGRSGAGKSTLVNLLLRFYDVHSGRILIDGQNIAECTQQSLRANIAMVTQDTSLLHRTVRDNIRYGKPDATDEEVMRAAKLAEVDQFLPKLVDPHGNRGYDALVGERGVKLSGGQRQRIAIARVILKNAPILVLDEATSALDSEVEQAIQSQLTQLMEGKTVIAIAHRLSTIAAMDRLVVMDAGTILEQGTHQELLAKGGLYAQLWERQSGGFLPEE
ncbi:ABC transporter ATP-binding protein [Leucothrix pacifica]|uniref:Multidrug ABC transporter ATP-binding protein n=1 Tax=Leucothrix pacifica TaxID=1247513 RepID=A0A317C9N7_9GAMM|nr:ABC transporter ATP-binding protein [Leucothrix pacifica]PWQ95077.1 multidrug ABC transporter ATP-binding protein [Leucothrix pacifica]